MKLKKLSIIYAALACLILASNAFAEEQPSFIRKVLGGGAVTGSIQTKGGGYAYLNGDGITKVDPSGKLSETSLTFDPPYDNWQTSLEGMAQTSDGFVLVGWFREGYYGIAKGIVVKVNMEGRVVWNKLFSGKVAHGTYALYFFSVIPTADGGFIVTGVRGSNPDVIRFSSSGNILWSKWFDIAQPFLQSVPTLDGGVILSAYPVLIDGQLKGTNIIQVNGSGKVVWAVTLEMGRRQVRGLKEYLLLHSLTALSDHGYLIAGKASDSNKLFLVRLNADGTFHSKAAYSLKVPDFWAYSLAQTPSGGIAIAGSLWKETGGYDDGFFLKTNNRQDLIFQKRLGLPQSEEWITSVFAKKDGSYLLLGSSQTERNIWDTLFVRLNSNGLVPGCDFTQNLNASRVSFGSFNHKSVSITPEPFTVPPGKSIKITSILLNRQISNACAN